MICDLFENQEINKWVKCTKEGHVIACKDHKIKSNVHRISGDIPLSNYIHLPQTSSHSLNITHKYLYTIFKPTPGRYFIINSTCSTPSGLLVKISLSNLFKQLHCGKAGLQIPYVFNRSDVGSVPADRGVVVQTTPTPDKAKWSILVFDLPQLFSRYCLNEYGYLRSVQLCANMVVKGVYTSDQLLTPNALPQCMSLPLTSGLNYSDLYDYVIVPSLQEATPINTPSLPLIRHVSVEQGQSSGKLERNNEITEVGDRVFNQEQSTELLITTTPRRRTEKEDTQMGSPLMLQMTRIVGIGPCYKGFINKFGNRVFYCCNSVIVAMDTYLKQQQFFIGHSNKVCSIDVYEEGLLLASTDINGLLMLWDISSGESCQVVKTTTPSSSSCVSFSPDGKMLCCLWAESMTRSSLVLYNIPNMTKITSHTHLTIHSTVMKFISSNTIATCGRGHIRICRIKNKCLRSSPVVIDDYHDHTFTDIATLDNSKNIYTSCTAGLVFEVDVNELVLIRVWSLYPVGEDPIVINSLSCDDQYCVTGCGDGTVRVWPLDFNMIVMETELDNPAMFVGVASGVVMCTTQTSIGLLDTNEQGYTTLIRSMSSVVTDVAINSDEDQIITCTENGLLQLWNLLMTKNNKHMVYQFSSANDTPTSLCFIGGQSLILCGYSSGTIRIISLSNSREDEHIATIEHRFDDGAIVGVASLCNGERAYAATVSGTLVMIDSNDNINGYPIMKTIDNSVCVDGIKGWGLVVSNDDTKLACISSSNQIAVYNAMTLIEHSFIDISTIIMPRPSSTKCFISHLCYSSNNLYVLTSNGKILKYNGVTATCSICSITTGEAVPVVMDSNNDVMVIGNNDGSLIIINEGIEEVFIGHRAPINKVLITGSHVVSVADNELIIWAWHPPVKALPPISRSQSRPQLHVSLSTSKVSPPSTSSPPESHDSMSGDLVMTEDVLCKPHELFVPPIGSEVIQLQQIIGHTGNGRGTSVQWYPQKDLVCYTCGCVVIMEDLRTTQQHLLTGHHTEVIDIRLQSDGCGLATASCSCGNWDAEIKIWENVEDKWTCIKTICDSSINGYSCPSFSPDNRYFLAISVASNKLTTPQSCNLLIWSCDDYSLLSMIPIENQLITMIAWDQNTAYEFTTVGVAGIQFWLLEDQSDSKSIQLKTHVPSEKHQLLESSVICYNRNYLLFVGSTKGMISAWSTIDNSYIMKWSTGIGKIVDICSNHGKLIVGGVSCIQLWDMQCSTKDNSVGISNIISKCTVTLPDTTLVSMVFNQPTLSTGVVSTTDHTLYVIDWNEVDPIQMVDGHHGNITSVDVSDSCIVTSDNTGTVKVWSILGHTPQLSFHCVLEFGNKNKDCVGVLAPPTLTTPSNIVCGYSDSQVMLMRCSKGAEHHESFQLERINMTKIIMKDDILVSGYVDGRVLINEVANGNHLATLTDHRGAPITDLSISKEKISVPGISIHSFHLLIISSDNGRVSIWKLSHTPSMIDWISFPRTKPSNKNKPCNAIAPPTLARFMYPDVIAYVTGSQQPSVLQYYSLTQKQIVKEIKLKNSVSCMCLSHDYQLIVFGSYDQILTVMDTDEGSFQEYHAHHQTISNLIFNPSDTHLISTCAQYFAIWKVN